MTYTEGEITGRLRHFGRLFGYDVKPLFEDAADEIERLRRKLREIHEISQEHNLPAWQVIQNIAATAASAVSSNNRGTENG